MKQDSERKIAKINLKSVSLIAFLLGTMIAVFFFYGPTFSLLESGTSDLLGIPDLTSLGTVVFFGAYSGTMFLFAFFNDGREIPAGGWRWLGAFLNGAAWAVVASLLYGVYAAIRRIVRRRVSAKLAQVKQTS